jgi:hypothetical protein
MSTDRGFDFLEVQNRRHVIVQETPNLKIVGENTTWLRAWQDSLKLGAPPTMVSLQVQLDILLASRVSLPWCSTVNVHNTS